MSVFGLVRCLTLCTVLCTNNSKCSCFNLILCFRVTVFIILFFCFYHFRNLCLPLSKCFLNQNHIFLGFKVATHPNPNPNDAKIQNTCCILKLFRPAATGICDRNAGICFAKEFWKLLKEGEMDSSLIVRLCSLQLSPRSTPHAGVGRLCVCSNHKKQKTSFANIV